MAKLNDQLIISMPAEVKLKIRLEAEKKKMSMGRLVLQAWIKTLSVPEQRSMREAIGAQRHKEPGDVNLVKCDTCGLGHPRMPSFGPWHDATCPEWRQRGYN